MYKLVTWCPGHVGLVNNPRLHLIFDTARVMWQVELKMLLMNVLHSYCSLRKVLRTCMNSCIDCLNHVYKTLCWIFTRSTAFQQPTKKDKQISEFINSAALFRNMKYESPYWQVHWEQIFAKNLPWRIKRSIKCIWLHI